MSIAEDRLSALGLQLPQVSTPVANYIPAVRTGNLLFVAGQVPRGEDGAMITGKVGDTMDVDAAYEAARNCGLFALAAAKAAIGDLDNVVRVVRVMGLVNATPDFSQQPAIRRRLAPRWRSRRGRVALRGQGLTSVSPERGVTDQRESGLRTPVRTTAHEREPLLVERGPIAWNPGHAQRSDGALAAYRAAWSVFVSSIAIVIGPTPPGTGVIADAFSATGS